jgi:hypothetical protein
VNHIPKKNPMNNPHQLPYIGCFKMGAGAEHVLCIFARPKKRRPRSEGRIRGWVRIKNGDSVVKHTENDA